MLSFTEIEGVNPLPQVPFDTATVAPNRAPVNPAPRILVVEDEPAIRELSATVLAQSGHEVDAAADGAAGWEALHARSYHLLLTDNSMPRLTGVELVKKLRTARLRLPVILATGVVPTEELDRHPWLQIAATLIKPFTAAQLLATVHAVRRAADRVGDGTGTCCSVGR